MSPRSNPTVLLLTACGALVACASSPQPREQRLDEAFAQIQVHEANIAEAVAEASRDDQQATEQATAGECGARCERAAGICQESDALCALADAVEDGDALIRCEHARRTCEASRPDPACRCED